MGSVILVFQGPPEQRQTVKVTAMQPLEAVLPAACSKFKPALDPLSLKLTLNKKPVDVNSPFRLANIPAGSILTISSYQPATAPAKPPQPQPTPIPIPIPIAQPPPPTQPPSSTTLPPSPAPAAQQPTVATSQPPAITHVTQETAAPQPPQAPVQLDSAMPDATPPTGGSTTLQPPIPIPGPPAAVQGGDMQTLDVSDQAGLPQQPTQAAAPVVTPAVTPASHASHVAVLPEVVDLTMSQPEDAPGQDQLPHQAGPTATSADEAVGSVDLVDLLRLGQAVGWQPTREALLTTEAALQQQAAQHQQQAAAAAAAAKAAKAAAAAVQGGGGGEGSGGPQAMEVDGGEDEDAFFELTTEDLAAMVRAAEAKRKEEAAGLKTQAMRDAEERAKMMAFGRVAIRLRFPDGVVLQTVFASADKLQDVRDLVRSLLKVPSTPVTLFITPPKQVLKDLDMTLYKAGLVPAALVHVQMTGATGSTLGLLRPEAAACFQPTIPVTQPLPGQGEAKGGAGQGAAGAKVAGAKALGRVLGSGAGTSQGSGSGRGGQAGASAGEGSGGGPSNYATGQGKMPKWLRLK